MIDIVFKNENMVIISKPAGVPSQSDKSGAADAMTLTSQQLHGMGEDDKLWLIHRLDRGVGGLLVFARNRRCAAELSALVSGEGFNKEYIAVVKGNPKDGEYRDFLFKDSTVNKAYVIKTNRRGAREAVLSLENVRYNKELEMSLVRVKLKTGRFHQIRCQLSSRCFPIVGDRKYGGAVGDTREISLFSCRLSFRLFGIKTEVSALPDLTKYPFNAFEKEIKALYEN